VLFRFVGEPPAGTCGEVQCPGATEDLGHWNAGDPALARWIEGVLHDLRHDASLPARMATPLTLQFPRLLSVKITAEHRLVYEQVGGDIIVHQCRYHY
jgi:toxin YoeB